MRAPTSRPRVTPLAFLLALPLALLGPAVFSVARAAPLRVERVELNVRLDVRRQALYAKAAFFLHNPGPPRRRLELHFPASLSARVTLRRVWDREGELSWQSGPVQHGRPRSLVVFFREPLEAEEDLIVVVSYDLQLENFNHPDAGVSLSRQRLRLLTTGWYPEVEEAGSRVPGSLRLAVRLPKDWRVKAPADAEPFREGTLLRSYELEIERVEPNEVLLHATRPPG